MMPRDGETVWQWVGGPGVDDDPLDTADALIAALDREGIRYEVGATDDIEGELLAGEPITAITGGMANRVLSAARMQPRRGVAGTRLSDATVNRIAAAGAAIFSHAVDEGWLDRAPTDDVRRLTEARKIIRVLTGVQALALVEHLEPHWRPMVLLILLAGLRLGEAQHLAPGDVDLERGRLIIRLGSEGDGPKSGHERVVPIVSTRLGDALAEALAERHREGDVAPVLALPDGVRRHLERRASLTNQDVRRLMAMTDIRPGASSARGPTPVCWSARGRRRSRSTASARGARSPAPPSTRSVPSPSTATPARPSSAQRGSPVSRCRRAMGFATGSARPASRSGCP